MIDVDYDIVLPSDDDDHDLVVDDDSGEVLSGGQNDDTAAISPSDDVDHVPDVVHLCDDVVDDCVGEVHTHGPPNDAARAPPGSAIPLVGIHPLLQTSGQPALLHSLDQSSLALELVGCSVLDPLVGSILN